MMPAAVFFVALALRVGHVLAIRDAPFFSALIVDAAAYDAWAQRLAGGDWLGSEVFYQAPLYPYFLGVVYALFGRDLLLVRLVQAVLGALSCVWVALAAREYFSRPVGWWAGLLLACYPPAIFFDSLLQKSVLDSFFLGLLLLAAALARGRRAPLGWVAAGAALGALSLTRENALLLGAAVGAWIVFADRSIAARARLAGAAAFVGGLLLVLLPVGVRNLAIGGELTFTTSQLGPNLYIGNNERADGGYVPLRWSHAGPEFERRDATELAEAALGRPLTPAEVSRYWTGRALAFAIDNPGRWLRLMARKWLMVWNDVELTDGDDLETYRGFSPLLSVLGGPWRFGVLVPLAVLGFCLTWRRRDRLWLLYACILILAGSTALFYVFARYRYPLAPLLVMFAGAALVEIPGRMSDPRRLLAPGALALAAAVVANWPLIPLDEQRAAAQFNLGTMYKTQGRYQEALAHLGEAVRIQPAYAEAHSNIGATHDALGRADLAELSYRRAIEIMPDYADARYNLASALHKQARFAEAAAAWLDYLRLEPADPQGHLFAGIALANSGDGPGSERHFGEAVRLQPGLAAAVEAWRRGAPAAP